MLTCGIVILNYEDYKTTEFLLTHIKDYPEIEHIVVVDNASPNDSYTYLKQYESDKISVIQSGKNGGYSFGNNFGARYLIDNFHPDIIGIANPDTIFDGAFVGKIKAMFTQHPDYAELTGLQVKPSGEIGTHPFWEDESSPRIWFKLALRRILPRSLANLLIPDNYIQYLEDVRHSAHVPHQVWAVEGSLFFIRADDFVKIGMFDENVFIKKTARRLPLL